MTSQSNDSKVSLNKISNFILSEQNLDIKAYTSGHLNENHLWKPPQQKSHKTWDTAKNTPKNSFQPSPRYGFKTPKTSLTKSNYLEDSFDESRSEEKIRHSFTDFSIGTRLISINTQKETYHLMGVYQQLKN